MGGCASKDKKTEVAAAAGTEDGETKETEAAAQDDRYGESRNAT